jgi:primosomal protein N' (replication factor Y)
MGGKIARVLTELALNREFDYRIPEALEGEVCVGRVVRMPFGRRRGARGFVTAVVGESEWDNLKELEGVEGDAPLFDERMVKLTRWLAGYYAAPFERALAAAIPAPVRREGAGFARQWTARLGEEAPSPEELEKLAKRAPRQAAAWRWLADRGASAVATAADLGAETGVALTGLRALAKKGWVRLSEDIQWRAAAGGGFLRTVPPELTAEQAAAFGAVRWEMDAEKPRVTLLHGVTGSGKTEVYLRAISHALETGRGAIALVPEIALTPQTVERFVGRFGETVAVLHSHLSDGERYDEWQRIARGKARVAVGARSALFAPVKNLGVLIVDEEHEPAYKQEEAPRYHARDVAVMRGRMEGCAVVLGSATPSMESYRNAVEGKYRLVEMLERVDGCVMPRVMVVDMRAEKEKEEGFRMFSKELEEAIRVRLGQGEQTMLFLNRRGYATTVMCPACGHVEECGDCSVKMTYHRAADLLMCHVCGKTRAAPGRCPQCGSAAIKMSGVGTQRVEAAVRRLFPEARVARMDSDTTGGKESHAQILGKFRRGETDILIGTQMIAKGLDFPNVTLVGVVAADMSLQMPDFRAAERTFQLLTQVAGRAGRGDVPGDVYIQTFAPFHPAVQCARNSDYRSFYDQEIVFRREMGYPPYTRLTVVRFTGEDEGAVNAAARALGEALEKAGIPEDVRVNGPAPAAMAKAKGQYRVQLFLWGKAVRDTSRLLWEAMKGLAVPKGVSVGVNVDAGSVM